MTRQLQNAGGNIDLVEKLHWPKEYFVDNMHLRGINAVQFTKHIAERWKHVSVD